MPICMHVCTSMCIFRFIISQILCQDIQITTNLTQVIKFRKSHSLKLYILANNAKFILSVEINTEFFFNVLYFFLRHILFVFVGANSNGAHSCYQEINKFLSLQFILARKF